MSATPRVSGREVVRALERAGWYLDRVRGSHHISRRMDGRGYQGIGSSAWQQGNKTLPIATLEAIVAQSDLSAEELVALIRGKRL